jgi:hypothetical protein
MVQLFGSKKEPWVEGADSPDRTQITETSGEGEPTGDDDNEKTHVVDNSRAYQQLMQHADAAAWQGQAMEARRPAMPFEQRTPPGGNPSQQQGMQHQPMTATLTGAAVPPGRMPTPPSFEAISDVGARPLIDDKLGWSTNVGHQNYVPQGGATRLQTTPGMGPDLRIRSNRGWIVLALLVLAGLGTGIVLAWQGYL